MGLFKPGGQISSPDNADNADNGIISTFVKLSFLSLSVMRQI